MTPARIFLLLVFAAALGIVLSGQTIFHQPGGVPTRPSGTVVGAKITLLAGNQFVVSAQPASLACYLNGVRQSVGDDFTWNAATNTATPTTGSALASVTSPYILLCDYVSK